MSLFKKKKKVNVDPETGITKERLYEQIKRKCHMNIRVMLSSTKEHLRLSGLEDARKRPSLEPSERPCPCWPFIWTSILWNCQTIEFWGSMPSNLWYFVIEPWEINIGVPLEIIIVIIKTWFLMETAKSISLNNKFFTLEGLCFRFHLYMLTFSSL